MTDTPNPSTLSPIAETPMHTVRTDPKGRVFVDGVETGHLADTPRRILQTIMAHSGVATKEHLLTAIWAERDEPYIKIIDVFICKIRQALGEHGHKAIETVWGRGYAHGESYRMAMGGRNMTAFQVDADLLAETAFGAGVAPDALVYRLLRAEHARQWGTPLPRGATDAVRRGARPAA